MIDTTSIVTRDGREYAVVGTDGTAMPVQPTGTHRNDAGYDDDRTGYPVYREICGETIKATDAEIEGGDAGVML